MVLTSFSVHFCGKGFYFTSELNKHLKVHSDERNYKCSFGDCTHTYEMHDELKWHQNKIHVSPQTYNCTFCSKAFHCKKKHYNKHSVMHSKKLSVNSYYCPAVFKWCSQYLKHSQNGSYTWHFTLSVIIVQPICF